MDGQHGRRSVSHSGLENAKYFVVVNARTQNLWDACSLLYVNSRGREWVGEI